MLFRSCKSAAVALKMVERDYKLSEELLIEKQKLLQRYNDDSNVLRKKLIEENNMTASHGGSTLDLQQTLKEKEKAYRHTENVLRTLKDKFVRDSQLLDDLRTQESTLISEIHSTQVRTHLLCIFSFVTDLSTSKREFLPGIGQKLIDKT